MRNYIPNFDKNVVTYPCPKRLGGSDNSPAIPTPTPPPDKIAAYFQYILMNGNDM